jgi:hypothetical protein
MTFIMQGCGWNLSYASSDARVAYHNYNNQKLAAEQELAILIGVN